ncbi:MAG: P-II family nitrogen regulator [Methanoregula sp.]|nr:P-II family nitrogen regulator [Methanoregula sp.]
MKQIIAILRDERVDETKAALEAIGVKGVMFLYVTGRGEHKGGVSARELAGSLNRNKRMQLESPLSVDNLSGAMTGAVVSPYHPDYEFASGFLPKRMVVIITCDEEVNRIVQAIVNSNQTGRNGDGKIFICPMISAMRVRTGEQGDKALS